MFKFLLCTQQKLINIHQFSHSSNDRNIGLAICRGGKQIKLLAKPPNPNCVAMIGIWPVRFNICPLSYKPHFPGCLTYLSLKKI